MAQKRKGKQKNIGKWVGRGFLLALLIAAGVVSYLVWDNYFNDRKEESKKEEASKVEEVEEVETSEETEAELTSSAEGEEKKVKQYEGEDANSFADLTGAITYAGVSGGFLKIRVNIDQYLESGTCTLALRKEGANTYSAEARIVASASTATCEGFDVSTGELEGGDYAIVLYISSGEKTGEIDGEVRV